jgi:dUTP pyrophosphatase
MERITLKIKKLHQDAIVPHYVHDGDAGMDLYSLEEIIIKAGERATVGTGIATEFSRGYVALVCDKSGLASKAGIKTMGGVIDCNYRGEYKVIMFNTSKQDYTVKKGEKIAQVLIQPVIQAEIEEVNELSDTSRGEGGFGSTGLKK